MKDLPGHLREKYKNSELFVENKKTKQGFKFNAEALRHKKAEKQKTIEEKLEEFQLNTTEEKYLLNVFATLAADHQEQYFTADDIEKILRRMKMKLTRKEIELMIWEIDEHLDQKITQKEFVNMYKKCVFDSSGIEPKKIFHFTQFLMYCKPGKFTITVEDTLELLFVRVKKEAENSLKKVDEKERLEEEIRVIFGLEEKTADGLEREVTFKEYLDKINQRAIDKRKEQLLHKGKFDV